MPDVYVAAARYPLTVLRRPDPDARPDPGTADPVTGWVRCGLPMLVERRDGDTVCWPCEAEERGVTAAEAVQEALL